MKHVIASVTIGGILLLPLAEVAFAANPHSAPPAGTGGQPSQTCGTTTANLTPGNSVAVATAPGSAFNPGGVAYGKYAGTQPQNMGNGQAAQYDVACFQAP
jgi:hypothetical protein